MRNTHNNKRDKIPTRLPQKLQELKQMIQVNHKDNRRGRLALNAHMKPLLKYGGATSITIEITRPQQLVEATQHKTRYKPQITKQ